MTIVFFYYNCIVEVHVNDYIVVVATLALGSRPRQGVARLRESRGKKPGSQKEGSPGTKANALEGCGPRGSPGVITYSRESKEVRGSVRE
jgi:hypothetical protein